MKKFYVLFTVLFILLNQEQVFSQCGITIGPVNLFYCAGDSVLITVSDSSISNTNPFMWSPATGLNTTIGDSVWAHPVNITTYVVSKTGCSDSDSVVVSAYAVTTVVISGLDSICSGDSTLYDAGVGYLSYIWSTTATVQTINVSNAGTYTVTVTDNNGCSASAIKTLTVNPLPNCTISGNNSVCSGSLTQWCAHDSLDQYLWSTGQTSQCINVSTQGNKSVTVTDANGCSRSCNKVLTIIPLPSCQVIGNNSVCSGSSAQWCALDSLGPYTWSTGATTKCITIDSAGTYTVTVTGTNGCTKSCLDIFAVNSLPTASVTGDTLICKYSNAAITFTGFNGAPPYTFTYKKDNTGNIQTITTNGTSTSAVINTIFVDTTDFILLSVSDINGCFNVQADTATVNVKKLVAAQMSLAQMSTDTSVCQNSSPPLITFTGLYGDAPYTFIYTLGSNMDTLITSLNDTTIAAPTDSVGTFSYNLIEVSDAACTRNQNLFVTITVTSLPTASIISNNTSVCKFGTPPLITFLCDSGTPPYVITYHINNGGPTDTVAGSAINITCSTDSTGTFVYYLDSVSDVNGCSRALTGSVIIVVDSLPGASMSCSNTAVCQNDPQPYVTFTGIGGNIPYKFYYTINGVFYVDNINAVSDTIFQNTNSPGTFIYYLLSVSDSNGCSDTINKQITITVNPRPWATISASANSICTNDSTNLTFTGYGGTPPYFFSYSINGSNFIDSTTANNNILQILLGSVPGLYTYNLISVLDSNGCDSVINNSVTITIDSLPTAAISGNSAVCQNAPAPYITFTGSSGTPPYTFSYNIDNGNNISITTSTTSNSDSVAAPTFNPTTLIYNLIAVSDANGCTDSLNQTVTIIINPLPTGQITVSNDTVCQNDPDSLWITLIGSGGSPYTFIYNIDGGSSNTVSNVNDSIQILVPDNVPGPHYYTLIQVSDANACSNLQPVSAFITINPSPEIQNNFGTIKRCNGDTLNIQDFISNVFGSSFEWQVSANLGFGNSGIGSIGDSVVVNNDSIPISDSVWVRAISSLPFNCVGPWEKFQVIVNPKPVFQPVDTIICSQQVLDYAIVPNFYSNVLYTWSSNINPLIISGSISQNTPGTINIITDTLINHTGIIQGMQYLISLIYNSPNGLNCSTSDTLNVNVKPVPPIPDFTSVPALSGNTICAGSSNINFNITYPDSGVNYQWWANPSGDVVIGNINSPNTVISFDNSAGSPITIGAVSNYSINASACADSFFMTVNIVNSDNANDSRKIIPKEPGHLLIYPDNSLSGYQWGYDSVLYYLSPDSFSLDKPVDIQDQVYQFFIPENRFILNDALDTIHYYYWVLLRNGECISRVYYNGPYANQRIENIPADNTVQLQVIPNPNNGTFEISLHGNIYGSMDAKVYNSMGQVVLTKYFEKKIPEVNQKFNADNLPEGLYLLEVNSSDLKKVFARILILHY